MPEDVMMPAGDYKLVKQFRREKETLRKRDLPWSKRVFDIDEHKLFGRTAWGWFRITAFYTTLYSLIVVVCSFWVTLFMLAIIDPETPRWLKGPPGISMMPYNTSTISFHTQILSEVYPIADAIDDFLIKLKDNAIEFFNDANPDTMWGYGVGKPSVFIKLNKVIGFQPETYDTADDLPKEAPSSLDEIVNRYGGSPKIWITCKVLQGPRLEFVFYPGPYFEASEKMMGVQRVVAVQFENMPSNVEVFFECKIWARNIPIDHKIQGKGQIKFSMNMHIETVFQDVDKPPDQTPF
ncbi:sodium/potassium-transporting ATPase subunit beta-2 [Drosophila eugracilis]|uniref:sodium/potassium-transporting ATPase subunit beta-2 n=1 Tax=Drosophila eugracilis TaxID=29029 RepID=UPI001BDAEEC1|nr:sodium/potassium-transporting ATPase subunit beta-2 [Drosophila eugracilis]